MNKALTVTLLSLTSLFALLVGLWYSNVFAYTGGFPSYDYRVYVITKRDGGFYLSLIVRNKGSGDLEIHGYYLNGLKCSFKTYVVEDDIIVEKELPITVPAGETREVLIALRNDNDCNLGFTSGQIIELALETNTPVQYRTLVTLP
ncbi:hypothetical protein [Thermosphaera aggregans]|uniref:Uncharacterized protein n=1 Tax=Thermosphaera aggregans (strain DSM 11486 / M11TL) TaxID=633148 RepID=D5U0R5_THEAM|nr:hypothetical protein [Thermosphaera aggregans]ADG90715.1 hypothetical protein Tagg_0440 [Thermosphaera aggregans DSM 11486]